MNIGHPIFNWHWFNHY